MANIKNFGLVGVGSQLQLGKLGPQFNANTTHIAARNAANSSLINMKAAPAVALDDVVVKSQLDALTTNTSSGFAIQLGNVATLGDGSWSPGAVTLTDTTTVSNAIDSLNEILSLLVPASPPAFPNGTLSVTNTAGTSPLLAAGAVPDNSGGGSGYTAGGSVTRITATGVNSNTFTNVGPGNSGTLSLLVNGTSVGSRTLTGTGDNGTYGGLVISGQADYPSTTPGFWKSVNVAVTAATVSQGINKFQITHSGAGNTGQVYFVRDNITGTPAISLGSVTQNTQGTLAYSSGVGHYNTGGILTVGFSTTNLAGETYYGGSDPVIITGTGTPNTIVTSQTFTYSGLGITTPITRQTTAATAITPISVNVNGTNVFNSGTIQATVKNVNGTLAATNVATTQVLVMRGTDSAKVYELSIPVSGLGTNPNSNNAVRVSLATGNTPGGTATSWDSTAALPTYEAAVVAGVLTHNQTNYSTGYLPAGPNYSSGRSGDQWVTFQFQRSAVSTFKINVTGTYSGCWVKLPGVSDNGTISPNASNGWWNAYQLYDGNGVPGETGDTNAGCALGTAMNGTSGNFTITFGTQSSTNATSNTILVRIRMVAGQSITALSFSN